MGRNLGRGSSGIFERKRPAVAKGTLRLLGDANSNLSGEARAKEINKESKVSQIIRLALGSDQKVPEWANQNKLQSLSDLKTALRDAGMESSNLIVGIDFTSSNTDQGARTFGGRSLHEISKMRKNPYQMVLDLIGRTLASYDQDNTIPVYAFGDVTTRHTSVSMMGDSPCNGLEELLARYEKLAPQMQLSGPTSFAPLINQAIKAVRDSGGKYHILLIIGDGAITDAMGCWESTKAAIVQASNEPLSIIMIGVGDGPWDLMQNFDDQLPARKFDNFQFVQFAPFQELISKNTGSDREAIDCAFATAALQEVPDQYRTLSKLNMIEQPSMYWKAANFFKTISSSDGQ